MKVDETKAMYNGLNDKIESPLFIGWQNHEPSPIEFMHTRLMDLFHELKLKKGYNTIMEIDGSTFNGLIAKAKNETYVKYRKLKLSDPILKSDL
jgi:hypothetical protein